MAIACRAGPNDRFVLFEQQPRTDVATFYEFLEGVINQIGPGTEGDHRCFTMDNLLAHKHPVVLQLIVQSGHRNAFRALYYPVDGCTKSSTQSNPLLNTFMESDSNRIELVLYHKQTVDQFRFPTF
jgi:hypothetical protein